jgi:phosphoribosylformylglycinamidine (FGAM) synthase PurS component
MNQEDSLDDSGSQMVVAVESQDILELTITKTNLAVFSELGKVCTSLLSFAVFRS